MVSPTNSEQGWLPDYLFINGKFEAGIAIFADQNGRVTRFSREAKDLEVAARLHGRALVPGLVNGHSHTFQRAIRGRTEYRKNGQRDTFWTWREKMYHAATLLSPEDIYATARMAFLEMALSGITTVGEFHYLHHQADGTRYEDANLLAKHVIEAARSVGIRIKLLRTAYQRAGFDQIPNPGQTRFITLSVDQFIKDTEDLDGWIRSYARPEEVGIGLAPHSLRAVPLDYLRALADFGTRKESVFHMHVAEQPAEIAACRAEYQKSPVEFLESEGILDRRFTAIHAIHISVAEAGMLQRAGCFVCACPTSERNLGDGAVPANELAIENLSLGTDSQIQIDLLEDARLVEYHLRMNRLERVILNESDSSREALAESLFSAASQVGARSLAMPVGELSVGMEADFFSLNLSDPCIAGAGRGALLSNVLFSLERSAIEDVYIGGNPIVTGGRHPSQAKIVTEFEQLQEKLWGNR
jgi:formimidoylglutamate deiminase